jgi:hypothetical protein
MLKKLMESSLIQIPVTLITYTFYGLIIGVSLFPGGILITAAFRYYGAVLTDGQGWIMYSSLFMVCLVIGISLFLFFISGLIFMGMIIRLLSLEIKPGSYEVATLTVFRWLIFSGIYTMAVTLILPVIPMTFFSMLFFRIIGCKIGKNSKINSYMLNDAYLLEIGDNVIVGGQTDISCHIFENNKLILKPIRIGNNTMIGAHCYISPGVTIGKNCMIGLNSYIRQGKTIPDNTKLTSVGAVSYRTAGRLEKE